MSEPERYLSITEVVYLFNSAFSEIFPKIYFEGELSQISRPSSGHLYFTLKDQASAISCVMWRNAAAKLTFPLAEGIKVQCGGKPEIYNVSGRFQLNVVSVQPVGEGLLKKKFLELKAKLEAEGFFAEERKRQLPFFPKAIGIVTSATGAVIHDIMVKIRERMPSLKVYLIDVRVQGEGAAREIADAVNRFSDSGLVEVIIVARGGGSLEDLWAFNEEAVVRSVFASKVPVISGVGHEVDFTLCDFAADVRAPTPTAAAEIVIPKRQDLLLTLDKLQERLLRYQIWLSRFEQRIDDLEFKLGYGLNARLTEKNSHLKVLSEKISAFHPARVLANQSTHVKLLSSRLKTAISSKLNFNQSKLALFSSRLANLAPRKVIALKHQQLSLAKNKLENLAEKRLTSYNQKINSIEKILSTLNPQNTLRRGFSIVKKDNEFIRSAAGLNQNDRLSVSFYEGSAEVKVDKIVSAKVK